MTIFEYLEKNFNTCSRVDLIRKCAKELGRSERSVTDKWTVVNKKLTGKVATVSKGYVASGKLADECNSNDLRRRVKELEKKLEVAEKQVHKLNTSRKRAKMVGSKSNHLKFALCSDTHFGSLCCDEDAFVNFSEYCIKQKITDMYIAGDILAGGKIYRGQEYELCAHGLNAQIARLVDLKLPVKMNYHFITGNHDNSFRNDVGISVGSCIEQRKENWNFLGDIQADVHFKTPNGTYKLRLLHPDGGTAYAISYKGQKICESLEGGTKPHMISIGHFHKSEMMPAYRNIAVIQAGAFERQTEFMKRKGSPAHVGGWVIDVNVEKDANRVRGEFVNYY